MKELSIEQKAKRYDEAIERARKFATDLPNGRNDRLYHVWDLESIFPELKESEDEKIRKEIINYLECQSRDDPSKKDTHNKWISYIEKHALSKDDYDFLRNCARVLKIFGYQSYADRLTGLCPALGEEAKAMMATPIIFDESEDEKIRKELLAFAQDRKAKYPNDPKYINIDAWIDWLKKQCNNMNCIYDKELSELIHIVIRRYVNDTNIPYSDREKVSMKVLPYVELLEKQGEGIDYANKEYWRGYREGKQEILDKYTELEKQGEQKSYASETMNEKGDFDSGFTRMMEKEQKPAWSEEDEIMFGKAIITIDNVRMDTDTDSQEYYQGICDWLIFLKDRVQPQTKQKWSEEDEKVLCKCLGALGNPNYCYEDGDLEHMRNWLKSLRPQSTWKPSDEQMKAIKDSIEFLGCTKKVREDLKSLYEQLKKLREE